jgi:tetratricopeptide (TPR) repeat protein
MGGGGVKTFPWRRANVLRGDGGFLGALLLAVLLAGSVHAQTIVLKDGKEVLAKGVRRQGETIMATVDIPPVTPGQPGQTGELGYPIAQISRIEFPEPVQLKTAADLITRGKAAEALAQLEPLVKYYASFRDAPGSWWADVALLKVQALMSAGRDAETDSIVGDISRLATDPETVRSANALVAASCARHGDPARALELGEAVLKESKKPGTLAQAYLAVGQGHLDRQEWEPALLAFLEVPVFYPEQTVLLPQSMLGTGRAYAGLQDFNDSKATLTSLIGTYGASKEAQEAKTEMEKVLKAERYAELQK